MLSNNEQLETFLCMIRDILAQTEVTSSEGAYPVESAYGMTTTISNKIISELCKEILSDANRKTLTELEPYSDKPLRIKWPTGSLDKRPLIVARDPQGNYAFAILPKRKRVDNTKREFKPPSGSYKVAKIALAPRADLPEVFVDLSVLIKGKNKREIRDAISKIKSEVYIQNIFHDMEHFAPLIYGGVYEKISLDSNGETKKSIKVQLLAPHRPTLYDFISDAWLPSNFSKLLEEHKQAILLDLGRQLLLILTELHGKDSGYEHKDLKVENLLIKYQNGKFTLQVTDFGLAQKFGTPDNIVGAAEFRPPWFVYNKVKMYFGEVTTTSIKFLLNNDKEFARYNNSYARHILYESANECGHIPEFNLTTVQGKHDIWSAGIILYTLLTNSYCHDFTIMQKQIEQNPVLSAMLQLDQRKIPTANDLLQIYDKVYNTDAHKQCLLQAMQLLNQDNISEFDANLAEINKSFDSIWLKEPYKACELFLSTTKSEQAQIVDSLLNTTQASIKEHLDNVSKTLKVGNYQELRLAYENTLNLLEKCEISFNLALWQPNLVLKTSEDEWMCHLQDKIFLKIAACLTLNMAHSLCKVEPSKIDDTMLLFKFRSENNIQSSTNNDYNSKILEHCEEIKHLTKLLKAQSSENFVKYYQQRPAL